MYTITKATKDVKTTSQQCIFEMGIHKGFKVFEDNIHQLIAQRFNAITTGKNSQVDTSVNRREPPIQIVLKSL